MISSWMMGALIAGYVAFIFFAGRLSERLHSKYPQWLNNSLIYTLSLGTYCTAWTVFGSIQAATSSGMLFFAVYLGPALGSLFWWPLLRKFIRIKNRFQITSIADFLAARYFRSKALGALVATSFIVGFIPYSALQLHSLFENTALLLGTSAGSGPLGMNSQGMDIFLLVSVIGITLFLGLRRIVTTERNPGLVTTLAIESVFKLLAALVGGAFVVYVLNDGVLSVLDELPKVVQDNYSFMGTTTPAQFLTWFSYLILSLFAVLFLPRQFHVAIVENTDETHVRRAKWLFPLFLLLINLFVHPVAIYGLKAGFPAKTGDVFLLRFPMEAQNLGVTLLVYFGGLSASLGMIIASTVTLSTMLTNQILTPIIQISPRLSAFKRYLLGARWLSATFLILMAYLYHLALGKTAFLVSMGMVSFLVMMQFIPALLAGLYWQKVSKRGALLGVSLGVLVWLYTSFIPSMAKADFVFSSDFVHLGPWGFSWLKPESLFGLTGQSSVGHAFVWTLLFNVSGLVLGSLAFPANAEEAEYARNFLLDEDQELFHSFESIGQKKTIQKQEKVDLARALLESYFEPEVARSMIEKILSKLGILENQEISIVCLSEFSCELESALSGALGTVAAYKALQDFELYSSTEKLQYSQLVSQTIASLRLSPLELREKIDFNKEKEKLLTEYTAELSLRLKEKSEELNRSHQILLQKSKMASLGEMAGGLAHEVNTPLSTIVLSVGSLERGMASGFQDPLKIQKSIQAIRNAVNRISSIIRGLKAFSQSYGDLEKNPFESHSMQEIINKAVSLCQEKTDSKNISVRVKGEESLFLDCRVSQIVQVLVVLISNSAEAIAELSEKWIQIEYTLKGEMISIDVIDSGAGIPPEIADKIMQPFFTTKVIGEGPGLGLSIASGIVRAHMGELSLNRNSPHTHFTILIPQVSKQIAA